MHRQLRRAVCHLATARPPLYAPSQYARLVAGGCSQRTVHVVAGAGNVAPVVPTAPTAPASRTTEVAAASDGQTTQNSTAINNPPTPETQPPPAPPKTTQEKLQARYTAFVDWFPTYTKDDWIYLAKVLLAVTIVTSPILFVSVLQDDADFRHSVRIAIPGLLEFIDGLVEIPDDVAPAGRHAERWDAHSVAVALQPLLGGSGATTVLHLSPDTTASEAATALSHAHPALAHLTAAHVILSARTQAPLDQPLSARHSPATAAHAMVSRLVHYTVPNAVCSLHTSETVVPYAHAVGRASSTAAQASMAEYAHFSPFQQAVCATGVTDRMTRLSALRSVVSKLPTWYHTAPVFSFAVAPRSWLPWAQAPTPTDASSAEGRVGVAMRPSHTPSTRVLLSEHQRAAARVRVQRIHVLLDLRRKQEEELPELQQGGVVNLAPPLPYGMQRPSLSGTITGKAALETVAPPSDGGSADKSV